MCCPEPLQVAVATCSTENGICGQPHNRAFICLRAATHHLSNVSNQIAAGRVHRESDSTASSDNDPSLNCSRDDQNMSYETPMSEHEKLPKQRTEHLKYRVLMQNPASRFRLHSTFLIPVTQVTSLVNTRSTTWIVPRAVKISVVVRYFKVQEI